MADNKKNDIDDSFGDDDFAFDDAPDWADDAPAEPSGPTAAASGKEEAADPFQDAFGEDALGEDGDIFGASPKPAAEAGFDDAEPDEFADAAAGFGDADSEGFDFQEMLTPDAVAESAAPQGNPDDEFDDLSGGGFGGGEAFAAADGFEDSSSLFGDDHEQETADSGFEDDADPFRESVPAAEAEEDDPFGYTDDEEASGEGQGYVNEAAAPVRGRNRFALPLAIAAAVAVGYVGYTSVLPMFTSPASPPAASVPQDVAQVPSFPAALPGQPGGLDTSAPSVEIPAEPSLPSVPAVPAMDAAVPAITLPDLAAPDAVPSVDMPVKAADAGDSPSIDDIVGGEGRGGIQAMRDPAPAPAADAPDLSAFETRLSAIEDKVDRLAERLDRQAIAAPADASPSNPLAPQSAAQPEAPSDLSALVPPFKPEIVESATLKGVSRDLAWVSTGSGVVEVREGDTIPDAGRVLKIREYGGRWIVVTTNGLVVQ